MQKICLYIRECKSGVLSIKLLKSNATKLFKTILYDHWTLAFKALCKMDVAFKASCCEHMIAFFLCGREPKPYRYMKTFCNICAQVSAYICFTQLDAECVMRPFKVMCRIACVIQLHTRITC